MGKQLDKSNGELQEEFITATFHVFRNGLIYSHLNDTDGYYSGKVRWIDKYGNHSNWYTTKTAPKWLQDKIQQALRIE